MIGRINSIVSLLPFNRRISLLNAKNNFKTIIIFSKKFHYYILIIIYFNFILRIRSLDFFPRMCSEGFLFLIGGSKGGTVFVPILERRSRTPATCPMRCALTIGLYQGWEYDGAVS